MNLKEEIDSRMWHGSNIINDDRYFLPVDDAERIAESYAKEKAWECIKEFAAVCCFQSQSSENHTKEMFEKWWEENK